MREYVESGRVRFEEWSHLGLGLRFRAAAMGVPFLPTLTMLGSDLMDVGGSKTITCPYTGETLHAVPALFPDVALIHVHRADRFGNCQIDGYPHMDADIALAAATVLVTAEEIVSEDEIRRHPDRTVIPGFVVDAARPRSATAPTRTSATASTTPSPTTSTTYVDGINERGAARRGATTSSATSTGRRATRTTSTSSATRAGGRPRRRPMRARMLSRRDGGADYRQRAARGDGRRAAPDGTDRLHRRRRAACWPRSLAQRTHAPRLTMVVEGGIVGPQWRPGWLPISTNEMRAAYRAQMLPAITDAFLLAQRGFLDVGFIGGAQIDRHGNLNTSAIGGYARPKVRLPGQRRRQRHHLALPRGDDPHRRTRSAASSSRSTSSRARATWTAATRAGGAASSSAASRAWSPRSASSASSRRAGACGSWPVHPGVTVEQVREHAGFELWSARARRARRSRRRDDELAVLRIARPRPPVPRATPQPDDR